MLQTTGTIGRLKGYFRSGINYACYEDMLKVTRRKASGSLPKDILALLISKNEDKKSAILGFEKSLNETAEILGEIDTIEMQAINRTPLKNTFLQMSYLFLNETIQGLFKPDSIYKEKLIETIIRAEEKLFGGIKKYIPETQFVIITPLGGGMFGNAYKLEVFGENHLRIFEDNVLKVYRKSSFWKSFQERCERYMDNTSEEKLVEEHNKECEFYSKKGIKISEKTAEEIRKRVKENLNIIENVETKKIHGAMAEANISEFLRYFSGHRIFPKDGIAIPSFFGLGNTKFAINKFINKDTKADRNFNFERFFLQHGDFELNPNNIVNGIIIDMGGIARLPGIEINKKTISKQKKSTYTQKNI